MTYEEARALMYSKAILRGTSGKIYIGTIVDVNEYTDTTYIDLNHGEGIEEFWTSKISLVKVIDGTGHVTPEEMYDTLLQNSEA